MQAAVHVSGVEDAVMKFIRRERKLIRATTKDVRKLAGSRYRRLIALEVANFIFFAVAIAVLMLGGIVWTFVTVRDLQSAIAVVVVVIGGDAALGWAGLTLSETLAERGLAELNTKRLAIEQEHSVALEMSDGLRFKLIGGWSGHSPKLPDTVQTVIRSLGGLPPVRSDEISPDLVQTRAALERMRAESEGTR